MDKPLLQRHLPPPRRARHWVADRYLCHSICPNCGAKNEIVRVEAPSQWAADREVKCVSCGGSLRGRGLGGAKLPELARRSENYIFPNQGQRLILSRPFARVFCALATPAVFHGAMVSIMIPIPANTLSI